MPLPEPTEPLEEPALFEEAAPLVEPAPFEGLAPAAPPEEPAPPDPAIAAEGAALPEPELVPGEPPGGWLLPPCVVDGLASPWDELHPMANDNAAAHPKKSEWVYFIFIRLQRPCPG